MSDFKYPYDGKDLPPLPPLHWKPARKGWSLGLILALFFVGCLVVNITMLPVSDKARPGNLAEWWIALGMGLIGAEAGLLAIAGVFGPGSTLRRHLVVIPAATALCLAWFLGYVLVWLMHDQSYLVFPRPKETAAVMLIIPALFCASESPLWIFRALLQWRIKPPQDAPRARPPQLSIAGILAATAAVALSLGGVRLGRYGITGVGEGDWWLGTGVAAAFTAGISLAVLPIVTCVIFRAWSQVVGVLVAFAWISIVAIALIAIISKMNGSWPPSDAIRPLVIVTSSFAFGLAGPLLLARSFGYRLLWGKEGISG